MSLGKQRWKKFNKNIKCWLNVFTIIFLTLLCLLLALLRPKREMPTTIFFSLSNHQAKSLDVMKAFLREVRFSPFLDASEILFQYASWKRSFILSREVTFDAALRFLTCNIKRIYLIRFCNLFFLNIFRLEMCNAENFKYLKRETFDKTVFELIDVREDCKITLVCTNSFLFRLPVAFEKVDKSHFRKIMMWYSTNSRPFARENEIRTVEWNTKYIEKFVDTHLVWNNHEKEFLQSLGIDKSEIVGSVLLQEKKIVEKSKEKFVITFFDVTPFKSEMVVSESFYSEESCLRNLEDLFLCVRELNLRFPGYLIVRIKPKRKYSRKHSTRYVRKLSKSIADLGIEFLNPDRNLYQTVSESDFVVGVPFTSPIILGQELGTRGVYFMGGFGNWDIPKSFDSAVVVEERRQLFEILSREIIEKLGKIS